MSCLNAIISTKMQIYLMSLFRLHLLCELDDQSVILVAVG